MDDQTVQVRKKILDSGEEPKIIKDKKGWRWWLMIAVLILIAGNLGYLNYLVVYDQIPSLGRRIELVEKRLDSLIKRDDGTIVEVGEEEIAERAAEIAIEQVEKLLPTPEPSPVAEVVEEEEEEDQINSQVKEFFVPIGPGETSSSDWVGMTSAQVTVDSSKYSNIQAVYFEASLHVIGGQLAARLINTTDGVVYHSSEVSHNSNTAAWKTSGSFSLGSGSKIYQVQLRSSSSEAGVMDQARLRILVE